MMKSKAAKLAATPAERPPLDEEAQDTTDSDDDAPRNTRGGVAAMDKDVLSMRMRDVTMDTARQLLMEMRIAPDTFRRYMSKVDYLESIAVHCDEEFNKSFFLRYLAVLALAGYAGTQTAEFYRSAIAFYLHWSGEPCWAEDEDVRMQVRGWTHDSLKTRNKNLGKPPRALLTMTHLDAMRPYMKEEAYYVSCFCLKTGCRPGEALKLAATCVLKNKLLIQHDKRQRHDRKPRLESWYWKELDEEGHRFARLCEERAAQRDAGKPAEQSTHLFGGLTQNQYGRAFRQARVKAGLPEFVGLIVPHCGRHAFCNSVKRAVLSDELGDLLQMTPKTFQRYAKLQSEREAAVMQHELRRDLDEPDAEGEGIREALGRVATARRVVQHRVAVAVAGRVVG